MLPTRHIVLIILFYALTGILILPGMVVVVAFGMAMRVVVVMVAAMAHFGVIHPTLQV